MKSKINSNNYVNLISYLYKLHRVTKNQWISYPELEKLQEQKLKALLHHAYNKVDYYRELFNRVAIKPEDITTTQDLAKIPITTRRQLQAQPKAEITDTDTDFSRCLNLRTSGSTGMPLDILLSDREVMFRWLFYRRTYFANGGRFKDKQLRIVSRQHFRTEQWFQHLGIFREKYVSMLENIRNQLKIALEFEPDIIESQVSTLKDLALEAQKQEIKSINPRIIFSTAELLTKQDRSLIASTFQAEVFDYYACNECSIIAWECKQHSGYHINSDNVIVEFLKEDGSNAKPGEEGEIVITSLDSYTMPFIRYKLGDIGVSSNKKCPCGRSLPLMEIIAGRANDCLVLPNNRKISPYFITWVMQDIPGIIQYQIVQNNEEGVTINIVKNDNFSINAITKIKANCKFYLGNDMNIEINIVGKIAKSEGAKFKFIKSELDYAE